MNRRLLFPLLTLVLLTRTAGLAEGVPKPASHAAWHFLFIVDCSSSMQPLAATARNTVFDLLSGAMAKHLHRGDQVAIWTVNSRLNVHCLPPTVWAPAKRTPLAFQALAALRRQSCQGTCRLEEALAKVFQTAQASDHPLMALLITDGQTRWQGTAVDHSVNHLFQIHGAALRREDRPFVITMVFLDRQFRSWAISAGGGRIKLPFPPPSVLQTEAPASPPSLVPSRESPAAAPSHSRTPSPAPTPSAEPQKTATRVAAQHTPVPQATGVANDSPPSPAPINQPLVSANRRSDSHRLEPAKIQSASSSPRHQRRTYTPLAQPTAAAPKIVRQNSPSTTQPKPSTAQASSPRRVVRPPTPKATTKFAPAKATPPARSQPQVATETKKASDRGAASSLPFAVPPSKMAPPTSPEPTSSAPASTKPRPNSGQVAQITPPRTRSLHGWYIAAGAALLLLALGLAFYTFRPKKTGPQHSLITRAMDTPSERKD